MSQLARSTSPKGRATIAPMTRERGVFDDDLGSEAAPIVAAWPAVERSEHSQPPASAHRYAALAYVAEGEAVLELCGRRQLDAGDMMWVVDVVAQRVGSTDAAPFICLFRRQHGATPAAWRAARKQAKPAWW